ncbi:MAG: Gfo/Idh/MocA family oxidoreductase, partial [Oscillospiraceae bacterium]|nr:Gfo/Idh/MocA family oxidoreductase [Oscillospiraceae bacterium]
MKPITKEKIGWGMIGTGRIAREFSDSLALVPDGEVVAVGSRKLETAQAFAEEYGGTPYGSYEEMMQDPNVDIVYVATPHMVHEENVIMAAKYGKHILCEKPFAINRPQAERMFAAAKEADVFIMEGLWTRFFPVWQEAKKVIASGELGQLISIDAACCWGARRNISGDLHMGFFPRGDRRMELDLCGGALLDAGIYSLAAASVVMGGMTKMPKNIYSIMRFEESGVDSDTDIMLELEGGVTAHLVCSLHRRNNEVNVYFED